MGDIGRDLPDRINPGLKLIEGAVDALRQPRDVILARIADPQRVMACAHRLEDAFHVITSYSIHYTKLYDDGLRGTSRPWQLDPVPLFISGEEWSVIEAGLMHVITSYSIHYTKLYDGAT